MKAEAKQRITISSYSNLILPQGVKGVLLDLDNSFYAYAPCHKAALNAARLEGERLFGKFNDFSSLYQSAQEIVKKRIPHQGASHSRMLYFLNLLERIGVKDFISGALKMENEYWSEFFKQMQPTKGLSDFLHTLNKQNVKVALVSDLTTEIQLKKLAHLNIARYFDAVVTSEEAGVEKPDAKIFELALEKLNLRPEEIVMIGDDLRKDIDGAERLGITAIQILHDRRD